MTEAEKKGGDAVGRVLADAIIECAERNGRISKLSAEEIEKLKCLTEALISGLHMNILVNAELNGLPAHAALVTVVETMAAWDRGINKLAGAQEFGKS